MILRLTATAVLAAMLAACASSPMPEYRSPAGIPQAVTPVPGTGTAQPSVPAPSAMSPASVPASVMVGGAPMLASRDIIDNAVNSADHTTLVAAIRAAGLVDSLKVPGPLTVFAPTNAAFSALPAGTVGRLLEPQNRPVLVKVLNYHVVPGRIDAAEIRRRLADGGGRAALRTVDGGTLTATTVDGRIVLTDEKGDTANVTIGDVYQSNGVLHVIDQVLVPNS